MDKERIAELREEIARNKATGYHDEGIGIFDSPTMDAALDALEAAQAELATAQARIREMDTGVVVPAAEWAALNAIGYDETPCRHDHHGYCQEHSWFSTDPCPTGILQRLRATKETL